MKYWNTCGFVLDVEDGRIVPVGGSIEIEGELPDHDKLLVERGVLTVAQEPETPAEEEPEVEQTPARGRSGAR